MHLENLGDYNLLRQLGYGAFGQVYLAEHRFIKRQFALKILPEEICSDAGFMRRFEELVHSVALLDHPNIVKIHNVTAADGHFFLVTDPIVDSFGETMNLDRYLNLRCHARIPPFKGKLKNAFNFVIDNTLSIIFNGSLT